MPVQARYRLLESLAELRVTTCMPTMSSRRWPGVTRTPSRSGTQSQPEPAGSPAGRAACGADRDHDNMPAGAGLAPDVWRWPRGVRAGC